MRTSIIAVFTVIVSLTHLHPTTSTSLASTSQCLDSCSLTPPTEHPLYPRHDLLPADLLPRTPQTLPPLRNPLRPTNFSAPNAYLEGGPGGRRTIPTNPSTRRAIRIAHGVIMATSFVLILPLGGILLRTLNSRHTVFIHATVQISGYTTAIVGLGLGIWLGRNVRYLDYAHTIIGMGVLAVMAFQVALGCVHHALFQREGKRVGWWGLVHVGLGRVVLVLGLVSGGLGLLLAENTRAGEIAYGVVAGVAGVVYIGVVGSWYWRRGRESKGKGGVMETEGEGEREMSEG